MSTKKTYIIPERMHYDIFERFCHQSPTFICSTNKENMALSIILGLEADDIRQGRNFGQMEYILRARPTVEHTIHRIRV